VIGGLLEHELVALKIARIAGKLYGYVLVGAEHELPNGVRMGLRQIGNELDLAGRKYAVRCSDDYGAGGQLTLGSLDLDRIPGGCYSRHRRRNLHREARGQSGDKSAETLAAKRVHVALLRFRHIMGRYIFEPLGTAEWSDEKFYACLQVAKVLWQGAGA
jgi:hypothetical protein